jgi:integrase
MATVKAFIRVSKKNIDKANIRFRLTDGRTMQLFHKSNIEVEVELWDAKKECYKAKCLIEPSIRLSFNREVSDRKDLLLRVYNDADKRGIDSDKFNILVDQRMHPENYVDKKYTEDFFKSFDLFIEKRKISEGRKEGYRVIKRALQRYEIFRSMYDNMDFKLVLDEITHQVLEDIEDYMRNEHTLFEEMPEIFNRIKMKRKPVPRGQNRLNGIMSRLRSFFIWVNDTERTSNNPFKKYSVKEDIYGTPYYLTIEERNKIYKHDFSSKPELTIQRDIFVFQCLIGCRVGDLYKMTRRNVINGAIEYVARKTKEENPVTVRVPLNDTAKNILDKYKQTKGRLFPFISEQRYNESIKGMLRLSGINRIVTVINPATREEEKRPLYEVASSHLARRTFVGNLYKKVKDPNLVSSLSGHKEGSRAFTRYRDIDEDMKKELVKMLE